MTSSDVLQLAHKMDRFDQYASAAITGYMASHPGVSGEDAAVVAFDTAVKMIELRAQYVALLSGTP